jgi:hypothetical protein
MSLIAFPQPIGCAAHHFNRDPVHRAERTGGHNSGERAVNPLQTLAHRQFVHRSPGLVSRFAQKFTHSSPDDLGDPAHLSDHAPATVRFSLLFDIGA